MLRIVVVSLLATAALGIISVLWPGFGSIFWRILATVVLTDAASLLVLACAGPAKSAPHRVAQVAGILGACLGLVTGIGVVWVSETNVAWDGMLRASVVSLIVTVTSTHACLMLPLRPAPRIARHVVTGTVLCTVAAAELMANYAMFPGFDPGIGYLRAVAVLLILGALGTILTLLLRRFWPRHPNTALVGAPVGDPSPTVGAKLPVP
ncbi:MAG TPA: hypothetical protein VGS19_32835 [Streptosporangiaceae bacterium]|nr:hypothetical protein [Streptosporangiaceae bacterium]